MPCTIDLDIRENVQSLLSEEELGAICTRVLELEGVERPCYVSVSIVDDVEMREINGEWRGIDAVTDVISLECERPDDPTLAPGEPCELGDIVLAPAYIARQAEGFGTTPADECRLLVVHGMLHLLGYDHLEEDDAERMEAREDELLEHIPHDGTLKGVHVTRHEDERA